MCIMNERKKLDQSETIPTSNTRLSIMVVPTPISNLRKLSLPGLRMSLAGRDCDTVLGTREAVRRFGHPKVNLLQRFS